MLYLASTLQVTYITQKYIISTCINKTLLTILLFVLSKSKYCNNS